MLKAIKGVCSRYLCGNECEETIVMLSVISIFLPFYITAVVIAAVAVRALVLKSTRKEIFAGIDGKLLVAFAIVNIATPIVFKNYLGVACFFGVLLILVYALYLRSAMNDSLFQKSADVMAFMSMCCAVVAVIQRIISNKRSASVFFNSNYYGAIIVFVMLMCVYRIIEKKGDPLFLFITIVVNFVGLLQADCQSAFFSIIMGVLVLLLLTKRYRLFVAAAIFAVLFVLMLPWLDFLLPRIGNAADNIARRETIWIAGFKAFLETPVFGRGMMGYMQIYEKFNGFPNFHCHNLAIDLLLSFGLVGAVPLVWFVVNSAIKAVKNRSALFFAFAAAVLVHGLTDVTIAWIQTGALAALFISVPYFKDEQNER